jgi:hypothetical protein
MKTLTYFGDGDLEALTDGDREHLESVTRAVSELPILEKRSEKLGSDIQRPEDTPEP